MQVSCTEIKINNYYKQQTRFVHSFRSSKIHNQQLAFSNNRYSTATRYITSIDFFLRRDLVLYFFVDRSSNINLLTKKGQKFRELSVHKYSENMIKKILHKDNLKKKSQVLWDTHHKNCMTTWRLCIQLGVCCMTICLTYLQLL